MRWSLVALGLATGIPAMAQKWQTPVRRSSQARRESDHGQGSTRQRGSGVSSSDRSPEGRDRGQIRREELRLAQVDGESASRKAGRAVNTRGPAWRRRSATRSRDPRGRAGSPCPERLRLDPDRCAALWLVRGGPTARLWALPKGEPDSRARTGSIARWSPSTAPRCSPTSRLGMVALLRTDGGVVGTAVKGPRRDVVLARSRPRRAKSVGTLFKAQRTGSGGTFVLPNPGATHDRPRPRQQRVGAECARHGAARQAYQKEYAYLAAERPSSVAARRVATDSRRRSRPRTRSSTRSGEARRGVARSGPRRKLPSIRSSARRPRWTTTACSRPRSNKRTRRSTCPRRTIPPPRCRRSSGRSRKNSTENQAAWTGTFFRPDRRG